MGGVRVPRSLIGSAALGGVAVDLVLTEPLGQVAQQPHPLAQPGQLLDGDAEMLIVARIDVRLLEQLEPAALLIGGPGKDAAEHDRKNKHPLLTQQDSISIGSMVQQVNIMVFIGGSLKF